MCVCVCVIIQSQITCWLGPVIFHNGTTCAKHWLLTSTDLFKIQNYYFLYLLFSCPLVFFLCFLLSCIIFSQCWTSLLSSIPPSSLILFYSCFFPWFLFTSCFFFFKLVILSPESPTPCLFSSPHSHFSSALLLTHTGLYSCQFIFIPRLKLFFLSWWRNSSFKRSAVLYISNADVHAHPHPHIQTQK